MNTGRFLTAAGAIALAAAATIPSAWIVRVFRPGLETIPDALLSGAHLFRLTLGVLGMAMLAARRVSFERGAAAGASWPRQERLVLVLLLAIAAVLRLYQLGAGLWFDEIVTVVTYARLPFGEIATTYVNENNHFLFTLLAHASYLIFGESAASLRLPAALFGVASIGALYLLGRRVAGAREALLASALFTFSYHHVWFSQNARGYSGLLFWALLSSWLLLRAIDETAPRLWIGYAVASALGVYTHLTMIFVVAGHFVMYLIWMAARRDQARQQARAALLLGFLPAGLLTVLLHSLVLPQMRTGIARTVSYVEAWKNPLWTLMELASALQLGFAHAVVGAASLAVFASGLWSYARSAPAVVGLLLLPAIIGGGYVVAVGHHLWPRFFFFAFGFGALVAVRGCLVAGAAAARLGGLGEKWRPWPGMVLCLLLVAASAVSLPVAYGPKQDYASALQFVEASRQPGDTIASTNLAGWVYRNYYKKDWDLVNTAQELDLVRARSRRTWLVYTLEPVLEGMAPEIARAARRDFRVVRRFPGTLNNGAVVVCLAEREPI